MNLRSALMIFLPLAVLCSCGGTAVSNDKNALTEAEKNLVLVKSDVFDGDKIRIYLRKDSLNANQANQSFLKGLDCLKNKKEFKQAIGEFEQSILTYPTGKAYYEMGNAYMETSQYVLALKAYGMAEQLNYEPYSKVLYNMACANSQLEEYELSARYLEYSVEAGYLNIDNIQQDPDLEKLRTERDYLFKKHLNRALAGTSNAENIYWMQFKKGFTKAKLPMSLTNLVSKTRFDMKNAISYDFEKFVPEMRDEKFSREVSKGFYFYSQIAEEKEYVALIYLIRDEFLGDQAPLSYRLVTYTHEGQLIDEYLIAGRTSYSDKLRMCTVNNDLTISIDLMETVFEKDIEEFGPYDNPIKSKNKVGEENLQITETGKIEKISEKLAGL